VSLTRFCATNVAPLPELAGWRAHRPLDAGGIIAHRRAEAMSANMNRERTSLDVENDHARRGYSLGLSVRTKAMMSSMLSSLTSNSATYEGRLVHLGTPGTRTKTGCGRRSKKV